MELQKLKTIVIDDSKLQRTAVIQLIRSHLSLDLVADYKNGIEARIAMEQEAVDLIFLDIEMPIINGFDFIESLKERPKIILITSKSDYAMRAFDYDVVDYLLKPITQERFNTSVRKVLSNLTDTVTDISEEPYIYVSSKLKKIKVNLDSVKWIEGVGDYIKIVSNSTSVMVLMTMKSLLEQLPEGKFMRVHKSYIVNLEKVDRFNGSQVEVGGQSIPLSRNKKILLEEALMN